jgi:hypothetical protein
MRERSPPTGMGLLTSSHGFSRGIPLAVGIPVMPHPVANFPSRVLRFAGTGLAPDGG